MDNHGGKAPIPLLGRERGWWRLSEKVKGNGQPWGQCPHTPMTRKENRAGREFERRAENRGASLFDKHSMSEHLPSDRLVCGFACRIGRFHRSFHSGTEKRREWAQTSTVRGSICPLASRPSAARAGLADFTAPFIRVRKSGASGHRRAHYGRAFAF